MSKLNLVRVLKAGAVASVLALSSIAAHAQPPGHDWHGGGKGGPEMMMRHMLDDVDATAAQRAQIKQIMQTAHNDLKPSMEQGRKLHQQAEALFAATNVDAAALESLRAQGQALREAASKRMLQARVDVARVLTPEQRAKIAARMAKREARMAEHMQKRAAGAPKAAQ